MITQSRIYKFIAIIFTTVYVGGSAGSQTTSFMEREVSFQNGSVELHGTLMLPAADGRVPAVVFLHGSGPHPRAGFRPYAEEFTKPGIASLFFDKRGSGLSGGSWVTSSLNDLAADALAAVRFLKETEEIDPGRIGFWGVSQAGWVAPLAAAQSGDIPFMILISGGGASPRESELFSYEKAFEHAGLSEAEKREAFEVLDGYFGYLATGEERTEVVAHLDDIRGGRLQVLAEQLERILPSEENRPNWSWVAAYDPAPDIERMNMPVLLMFGDRDTDQPTELAVERWREGLAKAGNDKATIMVFPGAGHGIRIRSEHSHTAPFADGYMEVMLGWLWRHVVYREK
jgi:uncharacterized protein